MRKMPPAGFFKVFYLVIRSGPPASGQWKRERRDIREDLRKIVSEHGQKWGLGEDVLPFSIKGVAVQGNSQHGGGRSIGLFRSIQFVSKDIGACYSMVPRPPDDPPIGV